MGFLLWDLMRVDNDDDDKSFFIALNFGLSMSAVFLCSQAASEHCAQHW